MRNYGNRLKLYKKALQLTQNMAQAVSEGETAYMLKLLKRRRILFNQIDELSKTSDEFNEESRLLVAKLQTIIRTIIKLDNDIKDKMRDKTEAMQKELKQIRNGQKLTSIYHPPVSHIPSKFVDKNIG